MSYIGAQPTDTPSLSHQTFYGFKYNVATGNLTIDVIDDDTKVIKLPDPSILDAEDYTDHFWSQDGVSYGWGNNGHIKVIYP
tara:strand:- start:114 stop:359 length:246 start_codon:yes stop_codon:yes gene_type:complete